MTTVSLELAAQVDVSRLPVPAERLHDTCERALLAAGLAGRVSLAVVDDSTMRSVNRDYHDCDEPTDVLAFALGTDDHAGPDGSPEFDAEIVVSLETAEREAAARGVETLAELMLYVVHGALHLLGFDDHEPDDARRMHERTLVVLGELGLENRIEIP